MRLDFNLVDFVGYMCGAIPAWRVDNTVQDNKQDKSQDNNFDCTCKEDNNFFCDIGDYE